MQEKTNKHNVTAANGTNATIELNTDFYLGIYGGNINKRLMGYCIYFSKCHTLKIVNIFWWLSLQVWL